MTLVSGPANCVGRSLALHEARTVLAAVVRRFDFAFAPGFESQDWLDQLKDQYILVRGKLRVVVTPRK
jgi:cytochrome P450